MNRTELGFIVDRSGSMAGLEKDTVGGFNTMLTSHRGEEGICQITTTLFNHQLQFLYESLDVDLVPKMTEKDFQCYGSTALCDAVVETLLRIRYRHDTVGKEEAPDKVLVFIITDGYENASCKYHQGHVQNLIGALKERGWEFLFLGANMEAEKEGAGLGIQKEDTVDFVPDQEGISLNFEVMCEIGKDMRKYGEIRRESMDKIRKDYQSRKK